MPEIGEMQRGNKIGYKNWSIYIWSACKECGKERWVQNVSTRKPAQLCTKCKNNLEHNPRWKGGRNKDKAGYILIRLKPDDIFFQSMANNQHYVMEHRLVMAKHLGRCLHLWEIIHHKNHIKDDNRIENLQLVTDDRHRQITLLEKRINQLEKRVILLEAENIRLQSEDMGVRNVE